MAVRAFARQWIAQTWLDLVCMAVVGVVALAVSCVAAFLFLELQLTTQVYYAPVPSTRTFPINFSTSGDIIYPQWAYPYRGWILPAWLSGAISIAGPIAMYLLAQIRIKSAWDASNAIMGTAWACLLGSLFQVIIKQLIGGFRPYFLDVCMPDISRAKHHNETGLNGVGFQNVMYTIEVCTQKDPFMIKNAITSFPSGHSTAAFAGFGFLFLWLNAKLKVWADHKPEFWKLALTLVPLLGGVMIACSLTIDAAHNWYDIVGGSVIGIVMALASYRASYAAVWDWRWNHIPLQQTESFYFGAEGDIDFAYTLTRSAGWGSRRNWLDSENTVLASGRDAQASGSLRPKRHRADEAV